MLNTKSETIQSTESVETKLREFYGDEWKTRIAVGIGAVSYHILSNENRNELAPVVLDGIDCLFMVLHGVIPEYFE